MHSPEVSIIIPAHNTGAYIQQAIDSALNQTLSNIEVIVVDDGSTDDTVAIVQRIQDERLKLLINPQNVGVSASRNRALQAARGEWLAVLDSDDWYAPNRLEQLLKIAQDYQADLVADNLHIVWDGKEVPHRTLTLHTKELRTGIRKIDLMYFARSEAWGKQTSHLGFLKPVFRRQFLTQHAIHYNESLKISEDFWLVVQCLLMDATFIFVPQAHYFYRLRRNSLTRSSQVERVDQEMAVTLDFLSQRVVQQNAAFSQLLQNNIAVMKRHRAYYQVIEPLKKRRISVAIAQMFKNPQFFLQFLLRLPYILNRRLSIVKVSSEFWEGKGQV